MFKTIFVCIIYLILIDYIYFQNINNLIFYYIYKIQQKL